MRGVTHLLWWQEEQVTVWQGILLFFFLEVIRLDEDTDLKSAGPKGFGGSSPSASVLYSRTSLTRLMVVWKDTRLLTVPCNLPKGT